MSEHKHRPITEQGKWVCDLCTRKMTNDEVFKYIDTLEVAALDVLDGSHKDGSGFWCGDYRILDNLKAALIQENNNEN